MDLLASLLQGFHFLNPVILATKRVNDQNRGRLTAMLKRNDLKAIAIELLGEKE